MRGDSVKYSSDSGIMPARDYIRDGDEIYRRSFAIIRAEADLGRFTAAEERVAVRIIHACGMPEAASDIVFHPDFAAAASQALKAGAPILCDSKMVANGITRARLPANNEIVCTLADPEVPALAATLGNTRSAAALELWRPRLKGSSWPSATRRPRFSVCSNSWTKARISPPQSSACQSASSARLNRRRR